MSKYINADELREELENQREINDYTEYSQGINAMLDTALMIIHNFTLGDEKSDALEAIELNMRRECDEIVCHCNVKENAELIAKIMDCDVESKVCTDVVEIPDSGIEDLSDGYHTFNDLYYQRMVLFATIVKQNKELAWKSLKHEDGELCFGGDWFIVGIDTPEGSYTYHYENKYWDMFDCQELERGKHWDGHTDKDVTRLLSLNAKEVKHGEWIVKNTERRKVFYCSKRIAHCPYCGHMEDRKIPKFCSECGADMKGESK